MDGQPDATVLGAEIHTSDPEELRYLILRQLTDRYAAERGIEVGPEDIDAYVTSMARLAEKDRKQRQARREEIERRLASPTLSDAERKALSAEFDSLNQLQRDLEETAGGDAEDPEEARQARRTVAGAFIRQWKINRALYQQYGGRVICQQGGPEPLDAYRRFLEEQQKQGAFEILNKDLEAAFWRYYVTDAIHSFHPSGGEEEQAFAAPFVSHQDWLPTFAAVAGAPDIKDKFLKGVALNGRTYKNYIDSYNMLDYLSGKAKESPRKAFIYATDEGEISGVRYEDWKIVFLENRGQAFEVWLNHRRRVAWVRRSRRQPAGRAKAPRCSTISRLAADVLCPTYPAIRPEGPGRAGRRPAAGRPQGSGSGGRGDKAAKSARLESETGMQR